MTKEELEKEAEWIVKAIETIKSGVADKLEKDNIKSGSKCYQN